MTSYNTLPLLKSPIDTFFNTKGVKGNNYGFWEQPLADNKLMATFAFIILTTVINHDQL